MRAARFIPARAGVGLKPKHYQDVLKSLPDVGFFEVHAENYMGAGGPPHRFLEAIRANFPLSVHGVGLSIGSTRALHGEHLERLQRVVDRYEPGLVSEHLAWSEHEGLFLNDLLPLPYTQETLLRVCTHIDEVQEILRRRLLIENPATYVRFAQSTFSEPEFLTAVAARTGCGLLLDVCNVVVSTVNHGGSASAYIDALPADSVAQIHLAGFSEERGDDGGRLLIDDHGSAVHGDVWMLYEHALRRFGPVPSLVEWDNDVPEWTTLLAEAQRADRVLANSIRSSGLHQRAHVAQLR